MSRRRPTLLTLFHCLATLNLFPIGLILALFTRVVRLGRGTYTVHVVQVGSDHLDNVVQFRSAVGSNDELSIRAHLLQQV